MPYYAYVSVQGDDKILVFTMDADSGKLELKTEVAVSGGPAPMTMNPDKRFLYVGRRGIQELTSYAVDQASGGITQIGTTPVDEEPCFVSTDRKGKFTLTSYYEGARVAVHAIGSDGVAAGPAVQTVHTARGAHSIQTDPSNKFAFVPHIAGRGPNAIFQFRFDENSGQLTPNTPPRVSPDEELGPRHYCFHPTLSVMYFSNEQACSVTAYNVEPASGTLTAFQTTSTLPDSFQGQNTCSQIQISPNGKFEYAPNRGHNSIAGFSVDPSTGRLTSLGQIPSEEVPRAFSLDPTGKFLFAAGLESGNLASYRVDNATGNLEPLEIYPVGARPMWVLIRELG